MRQWGCRRIQRMLMAVLMFAGGLDYGQGEPRLTRARFDLPPAGETRFVANEVILDSLPTIPTPTLEAIARRHSLTRLETQTFSRAGRRMHRWRLDDNVTVEATIRSLASERLIAGAQPNYVYALAETASSEVHEQYVPKKLRLDEAHKLSMGNRIL